MNLAGRRAMPNTDDAALRPIFLHGLWRSGSTFVWSRFRAAMGAYSYFEQLYPGLARLTLARLQPEPWREAVAANRHPRLETPYFSEFAPFISRRGVRGFQRRFAFDRFVLEAGDEHAPLKAYLQGLVDYAVQMQRRPVLGCNRTWLRTGWIRAEFNSHDVHIERDPAAIWASYRRHSEGGTHNYFTNLHLIVERNAAHPLLAPLAERLDLRTGLDRLRKAQKVYPPRVQAMTAEESYGLVYYMWSLALLSGLNHCDVIIDTGAPRLARWVERRVRELCGMELDFSGLRPLSPPDLTPLRRAEIEASVRDVMPWATLSETFDLHRIQTRLPQLSAAKSDMAGLLLERISPRRTREVDWLRVSDRRLA